MWFNSVSSPPAGVAQWIESESENQRVTDSIPSSGEWKKQPHIDVSLPLFLPLFPSLKIKSEVGERGAESVSNNMKSTEYQWLTLSWSPS